MTKRQLPYGMTRRQFAAAVVEELSARGESLAVAESLTGGLLASAVVDVPGASAVFRGGVVAYATDLKATLLGVDRALLDRVGAVHPEVALGMAEGVRTRLGSTWGLATTGVAGPDGQDGRPPGTVIVAVGRRSGAVAEEASVAGDRSSIRSATVAMALELLAAQLGLHLPEGWAGSRPERNT